MMTNMILKPFPPFRQSGDNFTIMPVPPPAPIAYYGRGGSVPTPGYKHGGLLPADPPKAGLIFNEKERDYTGGAFIKKLKGMTAHQLNNDSIKAKLEMDGLVIPVKYTPMVKKWMKQNKIPYKGPKERRTSHTQSAIVQPGELIIDKNQADIVIAFLKSQGIHLPNT